MVMTLYGLKNCDSCKKALKALREAGAEVAFVDIRADADLETLLPDWLAAVGGAALVNTRSTTWRGLSQGERGAVEADPASMLPAHPTLIKRPVIVAQGAVFVGWSREAQSALL